MYFLGRKLSHIRTMSEYIMQGTRADQGKEKYGGKGNIN